MPRLASQSQAPGSFSEFCEVEDGGEEAKQIVSQQLHGLEDVSYLSQETQKTIQDLFEKNPFSSTHH